MHLQDYMASLDFDRIETYRINSTPETRCIERNGKVTIIGSDGNILPNGIFNASFMATPDAELVSSISDIEKIQKLRTLFENDPLDEGTDRYPAIFKDAMIFYKGDILVSGLNFSFRRGIIETINGQGIRFSAAAFDKFVDFFFRDLQHKIKERCFYAGDIYNKWNDHNFPQSWIYNPYWEVYESTINHPIFSRITNNARLAIEPVDGIITPAQIKRAYYIMYYRDQRTKLLEVIWDFYNQAIDDYELPVIPKERIEAVAHFVKLQTVHIPVADEEDIILSFSSWDEEHGLHLGVHEKDHRIVFAY